MLKEMARPGWDTTKILLWVVLPVCGALLIGLGLLLLLWKRKPRLHMPPLLFPVLGPDNAPTEGGARHLS